MMRNAPPSAVINLRALLVYKFRLVYTTHPFKLRITKMATATLTWTNPTTRTDGSALTAGEIAHVEVFDGSTSLGFGASPFITPTLSVGAHAFTVVVIDTAGHSSTPSNVANVTVQPTLASPSPVTDLAAALTP